MSITTPHPTADAGRTPRIGYVVKMYPRFSETFVVTELLAMQERGVELEVFSLRPPIDGRFHPTLAQVKAAVGYVPTFARQADLWELLRSAAGDLPIAEQFADLVDEPADEVFQAVHLARWVRERGVDHLHAHFASIAASVARLAARLAGITWSMTLHAKDIFHEEVDHDQLRRKLGDADLSVTVSDFNLDHLRTTFGPEATARLVRIHNGIDLELFEHTPGAGSRAPRIVGVGRLVEKKGFNDLLEAIAVLRDRGRPVALDLVGGGGEEARLRQLCHDRGLSDWVTFCGPLTQDETRAAIRRASVMAAPCFVGTDGNRDGLPTVVLESLALGTPVVATPVTGMPEAVVDGRTGLLVGERDVTALADALGRVLDDHELADRVAAAGRELVEQRFDTRINAGLLHDHLLRVVHGGTAAAPAPAVDAGPAPTHDQDGALSRMVYVSTDPGVPAFGTKGCSVHVQAVLTQLVEAGHEVHLITSRPGGEPVGVLRDVTVHALPKPTGDDAAARESATRHADAQVARILDTIAATGGIDLVYERYALWGRTATAWARNHDVPSVLEVNAPLPVEQQRHRELSDPSAAVRVARDACAAATVTICVTDQVADWVTSLDAGARVHTVANGVDTRRFVPRPTRATPDDFTIGFVGTLKPWHGVEVLVDAFAALCAAEDGYRLLLVGDGPQRAAIEQQVAELGLSDRVELTGAVDPAAIPELVGRMDLAAAPYPELDDFYFSPLKVYEYLAAGVPVVASAIGDIPALLRSRCPGAAADQEIGALCAPGSPRHLAAAIAGLRHDPERRAALSRRGRETVVEHHDWSRVVAHVLDLAGVRRSASAAAVTDPAPAAAYATVEVGHGR